MKPAVMVDKNSDPYVPISTARDEKTRFTSKQKIFIKEIKKIAKKLEKAVKVENEINKQNEQIKEDIIALTEELVKSRNKKVIDGRIDELKIMHGKLNGGVLKIEKEKYLVQECNSMLEKMNGEIPV